MRILGYPASVYAGISQRPECKPRCPAKGLKESYPPYDARHGKSRIGAKVNP